MHMTSPLQIACMSSPLSPPETNGYSVTAYLCEGSAANAGLRQPGGLHVLHDTEHGEAAPKVCTRVVIDSIGLRGSDRGCRGGAKWWTLNGDIRFFVHGTAESCKPLLSEKAILVEVLRS
jgi:hypothetical protein